MSTVTFALEYDAYEARKKAVLDEIMADIDEDDELCGCYGFDLERQARHAD